MKNLNICNNAYNYNLPIVKLFSVRQALISSSKVFIAFRSCAFSSVELDD